MSYQADTHTKPNRTIDYPAGYGPVEPVANYRPWDVDEEFQRVFQEIRQNTMVDEFRLWILWQLGCQVSCGAVLEVGSWRGGSGALLASAASRSGSTPRVILADTFAGVVKAGPHDPYYKGGEHGNTDPDAVRRFLDQRRLAWVEMLEGVFPEEVAHHLVDLEFGLVHIDVDVYQSALDAFLFVWPRMNPGGVVVFDDYGFYGCEGVTACVNEVAARSDLVFVPNLSGQAVVVKT